MLMTFRGYKLHVILITCALIIIVGFGAQRFVYGRHVTASLEREFSAIAGVNVVDLQRRGNHTDVVFTVNMVPDFQQFYKEVQLVAGERLGEELGEIIVNDARTEALSAGYERIHLALHEAAVTGRFTRMQAYIDAVLPELPVDDYKISVDEQSIYVELHGEDAYLYERIPRAAVAVGSVGIGGGMTR